MAKAPLPEAALGLGQALLAASETAECMRMLESLSAERSSAPLPDALLYLGIAQAKPAEPARTGPG
jgi:hypothetical protein